RGDLEDALLLGVLLAVEPRQLHDLLPVDAASRLWLRPGGSHGGGNEDGNEASLHRSAPCCRRRPRHRSSQAGRMSWYVVSPTIAPIPTSRGSGHFFQTKSTVRLATAIATVRASPIAVRATR